MRAAAMAATGARPVYRTGRGRQGGERAGVNSERLRLVNAAPQKILLPLLFEMGQGDAAGLRKDPAITLQTMCDVVAVRKELRAMGLCVRHAGVAIRLLVGAGRNRPHHEPNKTEKDQSTDLCAHDQDPFMH